MVDCFSKFKSHLAHYNFLYFLIFNFKGIKTHGEKIDRKKRGLQSETKWTATDSDGQIAIPFSFHANFPSLSRAKVIETMAGMNTDIGCLKTFYIPEENLLTR